MEDATAVARAVRLRGFKVVAVKHSAYLGTDFSCGPHGRGQRVKRDDKHKQMSDKFKKFAKAAKQYRQVSKLEKVGAQPAGGYGFQVHGMFGQQLTEFSR
eukprot:9373612-Pyramimonas_sp.AAC.1